MRRGNELNLLGENTPSGLNLEPTVRGVWARVIFTMGWKDGINYSTSVDTVYANESQVYGLSQGTQGYNLKDEKFSIFSIIPHYRKSKH